MTGRRHGGRGFSAGRQTGRHEKSLTAAKLPEKAAWQPEKEKRGGSGRQAEESYPCGHVYVCYTQRHWGGRGGCEKKAGAWHEELQAGRRKEEKLEKGTAGMGSKQHEEALIMPNPCKCGGRAPTPVENIMKEGNRKASRKTNNICGFYDLQA